MDFLPETQVSAPSKTAKKARRSKTKKQSPDIAHFESLLKRRQELTLQAHQAQDRLDELKAKLIQAENEAESAWDLAIDMNAVIREQLTELRSSGVDDKAIYALIDQYNNAV